MSLSSVIEYLACWPGQYGAIAIQAIQAIQVRKMHAHHLPRRQRLQAC